KRLLQSQDDDLVRRQVRDYLLWLEQFAADLMAIEVPTAAEGGAPSAALTPGVVAFTEGHHTKTPAGIRDVLRGLPVAYGRIGTQRGVVVPGLATARSPDVLHLTD